MIFQLRNLYFILALIGFSHLSSAINLDSLDVVRFKKHVTSLDYISRQTDNSKYFLNLISQYCDSILSIDSDSEFAINFKNRINLTLATCDQNMNHKVELFPFFNGFPSYMGFADDPIEYAYDAALESLLESKYIKLQNGPISQTNISSIVIRNECDDEMFEIVNQILHKNTSHYMIPINELESILGAIKARELLNGNVDSASILLLCKELDLDRIGIFRMTDLDVINESIWLVQSEFFTYHKGFGFSEPIFTRGFNIDKRSVSFFFIFLLLLKSILIIAVIAFLNQKLGRIIKNSHYVTKDLTSLFVKKLRFVATFFVIPLVLSFMLIYSLSFLMPEPEDHFMEVSAKLWMILLTLGMSIVPTIINLYFVNRMDLDGFHTLKGYRYFANTSLYATYFPLFVFYIIQFEEYPIYPHFLLVGITLIIGDLLARSYFQYTSILQNSALRRQAIIGVILGVLSLLIFNAIILTGLSVENLLYSVLLILPMSALHYIVGFILNKIHEKELAESKELNLLSEIPYVQSLLNPKTAIYEKVINTITDDELNIMLVSGPAGIGKTRSLKEAKQLFIDNGWDWYYGDCDEIQGVNAISFEPFVEAFKELLKIDEFADRGKQLEATMGKAVNLGAAIVDIDSSIISEYERDGEQSISEMCLEIIDKLENRKNKSVFVMEDLHWVDVESYSFLNQLLKHINRNKFLRGHMCIILSMRDESLSETRGVTYAQLVEDLELLNHNSTSKFTVEELLTKDQFKVVDFVNNLSSENNQFKIQSNSLLEINALFNESLIEFQNQGYVTPLFIFKVLEKWINDGVLKYSTEGYVLTQNIDFNSLPNNEEIDSFYHSIIDKYEEKWKRLLESAAVIGSKFDANILTQVWNYELLEVLGFLEKAVNDKLLIDVSTEDNIYQFSDKRIISSIKSYFNLADLDGDKQIVIEYNKRYIQLHNDLIEFPHNYSVEKILPVLRRLSTLLIIEEYLIMAKNLIFEVVVRYIEQNEHDKLVGFNDFLKQTRKLEKECAIISNLIEITNGLSPNHKLDSIEKDLLNLECSSNSVALDLRIYALMLKNSFLKRDEEFRITPLELEYIYDKVINSYNGVRRTIIGLLFIDYTVESDQFDKSIDKLHSFSKHLDVKSIDFDIKLELMELEFMTQLDVPKIEEIETRSNLLIEKVKKSKNLELVYAVIRFHLSFISNIVQNDEKSIAVFISTIEALKKNQKITIQWVRLVLRFMSGLSGYIYFQNHPEDAEVKFRECEIFQNKIMDNNQWTKLNDYYVNAKLVYLNNLKKYADAENLVLDHLKRIEQAVGANNLDYHSSAIDLAKVYENLNKGQLAIKYRLVSISILENSIKSSKMLKLLATDYANISHVYRNKMSDGENAVLYAKKAVRIKEKFPLDQYYGIALYHLARALDFDKQYFEAADTYKKSLSFINVKSTKQLFQKLVIELNLGLCLSNLNIDESKKMLTHVLKEFKKSEITNYVTKEIQHRIDLAYKILSANKT